MRLKPRHKWFTSSGPGSEEWYGPHDNIEDAINGHVKIFKEELSEGQFISMALGQGRRCTKSEKEEWGVDFDWQIDQTEMVVSLRK